MDQGSRLMRIGIFYDGNYFYHVSNYYCYAHPRRSRLSIPGLHEFIKAMVSKREGVDIKLCQIVDCHYFRGRLPAMEASARQILLNERIFDDILMREGVVTHYLPMTRGAEKGVDVSLALETLELTIFKQFNIVVLIASDGDYVPLVRKLNALGTRVMVLGWDFEYMDDTGKSRYTSTSLKLLNEVSYPIRMQEIINGVEKIPELNVDSLFVSNGYVSGTRGAATYRNEPDDNAESASEPDDQNPDRESAPQENQPEMPYEPQNAEPRDSDNGQQTDEPSGEKFRGTVIQLKNGYGFLSAEVQQKNLFFFWEDVENCDFNRLQIGDLVEYEIGQNDRGECAKKINLLS